MKQIIIKFFCVTGLLANTLWGMSQTQKVVSGMVRNTNNIPLSGVKITVPGNADATAISDENGVFMIEILSTDRTLTCHADGYRDKQLPISTAQSMEITLDTDVAQQDKLVDIAMLQKEKRGKITGAVSTVLGEELIKTPVSGFTATLTGRLSGLTSIQNTSVPTADATRLYVRGLNSVNGNTPLVVLDGIPAPLFDMNTLDANSIESISLLKDAAAKVLYGARASSGVILITTKRGELGRNKISVSADYSLQQPTQRPQTVSPADYTLMRNQALRNDGQAPLFSLYEIASFSDGTLKGNDWYNMFMKDFTSMQRYNINVNGGNNRVKYLVNTSYLHQGSLVEAIKNDDYDPTFRLHRFNLLANVDVRLNRYLNTFLSSNVTFDRINQGYYTLPTLVNSIYKMDPVVQGPTLSDGRIVATPYNGEPTYGLINRTGYGRTTGVSMNIAYGVNLNMDFLVRGLSLKGVVGYEANYAGSVYGQTDYERYTAGGTRIFGTHTKQPLSLWKESDMRYFINFQGILNYERTFAGKHELNAFISYFNENMMKNGDLPYDRISLGGHVKYGYDNRYYLQGDFAYYGTEQFKKGNRFELFPTLSAAWIASNEQFLKDISWLSFLKIRASVGWLGNDQLTGTRFLYATDVRYEGAGYLLSNYYATHTVERMQGNEHIFFEKSFQQNYGIDMTLFNALGLTFDYWKVRQTQMAIQDFSTTAARGIASNYLPYENLGSMDNKGFDVELSYRKQFAGGLNLKLAVNVGYNENKVTDVRELNRTASGYYYPYRKTGYALGQRFGYLIDYSNGNGYYNSQDELNNSKLRYAGTSPRLGDFIYQDLNKDGVIDERDLAPMAHTQSIPTTSYGVSLQADYKNFDLYVQIQGIEGSAGLYSGVGIYDNVFQGVYTDLHRTAWTAERYANHEEIGYPALSSGSSSSLTANDYFYSKNNYLRLKNVVLGYTLPKSWIGKLKLRQVRFYVSGNNLLTTSSMKFKHIDPEQFSYYEYPIYRTFCVGVDLKF